MILTKMIYDILTSASLSTSQVWAGTAAGNSKAADGLVSFFQLPGPGADFATGTSNALYQFDCWSKDLYEAESLKDEVIKVLLGRAGIYDGKVLLFTMNSDDGVLYEQDAEIYHYSVTFNVKYVIS